MPEDPKSKTNFPDRRNLPYIAGAILIGIGSMILLSQYFKTTWMTLMLIPVLGVVLLAMGVYSKRFGLVIGGSIVCGLGIGTLFAINLTSLTPVSRAGLLLLGLGLGWLLITLLSVFTLQKVAWWSLVPAGSIIGLGTCLTFTSLRLFDFVLLIGVGVGMSLLIWGIFDHIFGLIIPGCIVTTSALGFYTAWQGTSEVNNLAQTGVMLVWFAIGWGLITLFSRALLQKFVWWPLIPGGVLAMVGWGLYISGNPDNAANFISNTGSVAMIILGLYLLLIRRGIQQ